MFDDEPLSTSDLGDLSTALDAALDALEQRIDEELAEHEAALKRLESATPHLPAES